MKIKGKLLLLSLLMGPIAAHAALVSWTFAGTLNAVSGTASEITGVAAGDAFSVILTFDTAAPVMLFLGGYLTYHFTVRTVTRFQDPAWFRPIYLAILLTHTVLAVVIVPLVLITVSRAGRERFDAHRRIARWTWPLWMYVSVTGVVIYLLLYQIFPQR